MQTAHEPTTTTTTVNITLPIQEHLYERIFNAYRTDITDVTKQPIDFNQWAINCLLDWTEAVEIEANRNE